MSCKSLELNSLLHDCRIEGYLFLRFMCGLYDFLETFDNKVLKVCGGHVLVVEVFDDSIEGRRESSGKGESFVDFFSC